ncbi:MAG: exodeoxyribonuclease VII large subunit [Verrucomicrobiales bacterium]
MDFDFAKSSPRTPVSRRRKGGDEALTVSQLTRRIRNLLEGQVGDVWVEGEVGSHRMQASGHQYFVLKDDAAQLSCVYFRGDAWMSRIEIANGKRLRVFGQISVYEARGQYQLVVKRVQEQGLGSLQARFEELKQKLAAEGLFDQAHKVGLPSFPQTIAVVTSPTGAAIRDMLQILGRRAPWIRVLIFPVRVQGEGASSEIAAAIRWLSDPARTTNLPPIDALIVARGGGSMEDLWEFNEEAVARALFECPIPTISAIGHEIDFTISDFVADLRAPTPSAAAEILAPDGGALAAQFSGFRLAMERAVLRRLDHAGRILDLTARGALASEPRRLLADAEQRLDLAADALEDAAHALLDQFAGDLAMLGRALDAYRPDRTLAEAARRIETQEKRLASAVRSGVEAPVRQLDRIRDLLRALGPESVFARGFSLTQKGDGTVVSDADQVQNGDLLHTRFSRGSVTSEVVEVAGQAKGDI